MINIILVEDHLLVRNGIKLLLDSQENVNVVAEANDGSELLFYLENNEELPDIVITDINMPGLEGLQLTEILRQNYPSIKVIVLTMLDDNQSVLEAFQKGVSGYLVKNVSYNELLFAIKHIYQGGSYLDSLLTKLFLEKLASAQHVKNLDNKVMDSFDISERELEVLQLISDGYTNMEIGEKLFLSKRTVEGHRQNLIDKMNVKNSASLIKFAVKNGLVE